MGGDLYFDESSYTAAVPKACIRYVAAAGIRTLRPSARATYAVATSACKISRVVKFLAYLTIIVELAIKCHVDIQPCIKHTRF